MNKMKNVMHIIYRKNNLFNTIMPFITKVLEELGLDVQIISFDRGSSKSNIRSDILQDTALQSARFLLMDNTCYDAWDRGYIPGIEKFFLDSMMAYALGDMWGSDDERYKDFCQGREQGDRFKYLKDPIVNIFRSLSERPKNVVISKDHITSHVPFSYSDDKLDETVVAKHTAEVLQKWMTEAGLNPVVHILESYELEDEIDTDDTWLIIDRHSIGYKSDYYRPKHAKVLGLPFENFVRDATRYGILEYDSELFESILKEVIKENIVRKISH